VIISTSRRFIFIHTMKTAGDSITRELAPWLAKGDFMVSNDFQAWRQRILRRTDPRLHGLVKHSTASEIRAAMDDETWRTSYKFAFVRHPVDRALSLYRFAAMKSAEREQPHLRNIWYLTPLGRADDPKDWRATRAFRESGSFSGFIRHPAMADAAGMVPQSDFLSDPNGNLQVDFVGKFESLEADMAQVRRTLGLPEGSLMKINSSRSNSQPSDQVSREDQDFLRDRFRNDYELFGYE
jgi:hypothetical protein